MTAKERGEGRGRSEAGARFAASEELARLNPDADLSSAVYEVIEEGVDDNGEAFVRVAAVLVEDGEAVATVEVEVEAEAELEASVEVAESADVDPVEDPVEPAIDDGVDEPAEEEVDEPEPEPKAKDDRGKDDDRADSPADDEGDEDLEALDLPSYDDWPDEPAERAATLVDAVVTGLDLDADVSVEEDDDQVSVLVDGDDLGLLIGKHGSTIDAIQLICGQAAFRGIQERKRVMVDAADYRARREEVLCRQADRAAGDALQAGRAMELDAMTSLERRVVHNHLKDRADVETHSEGDEPYRFVVVTPIS